MMSQRLIDPVRLGIIVGVRGIKGEVRIKSFTDDPMDIASYGPLYDQTGNRQFGIRANGTQKGAVLAWVDGVKDRNAAEALKRTELFIERSQLPPPDEDEFYNADLEGLEAVNTDGEVLGKIKGVFDFGAGPVLEISGNILVPFTNAAVPVVDIKGGKVVINPPEEFVVPSEQNEEAKDETT